ncbi:L,D-transpeptidase family protein [Gemmatimonas sp.]|uniref:L,D-transpeptidase family protein n=1 Tax=Gemmatimonas sp. TaxID=1962908 RepID=UPI0039839793
MTALLLAPALWDGASALAGTLPEGGRVFTEGSHDASARPRVDSLSAEIQRILSARRGAEVYGSGDWKRVQRIYAAGGHRPVWIDSTGDTLRFQHRTASLVDALAAAGDHALRVGAYESAALRESLEALHAGGTITPGMEARADVLLTASFVAYATDLLTGQIDPRSVNREWHIDSRSVDLDSVLTSMLHQEVLSDAIAALQPRDPEYAILMQEFSRYRQLVASGGWTQVASRRVLHPGDTATAQVLGALLGRLHAEGYTLLVPLVSADTGPPALPRETSIARGPSGPAVYDLALAGAVAAYQQRHGLTVDSVVGPNTLLSLNRPAEFRMRQLAANLERHRWLPRERGNRFVVVNVPAFRLIAYDAGREALSMNVIVGAEYGGRSTPVFSDSMSYVVFRPYWNVPQGIASRELWPMQRKDPSYFQRHGYEVVRASWGTYVRQKPALDNALGRVKFIFPNEHAIYLHDTPAQALFAENVRAFSHGCIRVEHPDQLAQFVLGPQGWDIGRVREAMTSSGDDHRVNLEHTLPVYIVYFTTYVRNGTLHFANDIYDRDDALVRAMGAPDPLHSRMVQIPPHSASRLERHFK